MKYKKILSLSLVFLIISYMSAGYCSNETFATRGEVVEMLLNAVDDYNPNIQKTDIIKGDENGFLHEEDFVTRAESLIMLQRAFGKLPQLSGHNARTAIPAKNFTDIPEWAEMELKNVFEAGIVAGTSEHTFSPDDFVTAKQMNLFIARVYSLFGTNERDDFYAAVNKDILNKLVLRPGMPIAGTMYDLSGTVSEQVNELIKDTANEVCVTDSKEQKICDFYNSIINMDLRNKSGIEPIKKYLDLIEDANTLNELVSVQNTLITEICTPIFMNFNLLVDLKDSTNYVLSFDTASPMMTKEFYISGTDFQREAYLNYLQILLTLGGADSATALTMAHQVHDFETKLANASLNIEELGDADKIYNVFTLQEIQNMFKSVDINTVLKASGLKAESKIGISDIGRTKALAEYFHQENIENLKSYAKCIVLLNWGNTLQQDFIDAADRFNNQYFGTQGNSSLEEIAVQVLQTYMPDYIGELYAEKYFSPEAKHDVENMVQEIIASFKNQLNNNMWMSETTKQKAIAKLDNLTIKIGYPDKWATYLNKTEITSTQNGGSYFKNLVNIINSERQEMIERQGTPVDKTEWIMYPFTVNACYNANFNDITFPAAILQSPMYDINVSYEQNLGGIGYVIAHEITHAFDNNGAKFDENGNATDWWEAEDYAAFQRLCEEITAFYDGQEGVPGIPMNGKLTLSENVADLGAAACITEIVNSLENPDYKTLYKNMAKCWATTATREYFHYAALDDVHSTEKLRVNRVLINFDEFLRAFDIDENDGMYLAPEERIKIW